MTAAEHSQLNTALIGLLLLVVGGIGPIMIAVQAYTVAKVKAATERIGRNADVLSHLQNGGGDAKIEAVISKMILDGRLASPAGTPGANPARDPRSHTRATDPQPVYTGGKAQDDADTAGNSNRTISG